LCCRTTSGNNGKNISRQQPRNKKPPLPQSRRGGLRMLNPTIA
jgi:hypothetical protein